MGWSRFLFGANGDSLPTSLRPGAPHLVRRNRAVEQAVAEVHNTRSAVFSLCSSTLAQGRGAADACEFAPDEDGTQNAPCSNHVLTSVSLLRPKTLHACARTTILASSSRSGPQPRSTQPHPTLLQRVRDSSSHLCTGVLDLLCARIAALSCTATLARTTGLGQNANLSAALARPSVRARASLRSVLGAK